MEVREGSLGVIIRNGNEIPFCCSREVNTLLSKRGIMAASAIAVIGLVIGSNARSQQPYFVKDINETPAGWFAFAQPWRTGFFQTVVSGGLMYILQGGAKLWRSDGTAAGTFLVKEGVQGSTFDEYGKSMADVGGVLYFVASDGFAGLGLWRTDGTPLGTTQVQLPGMKSPPEQITNLVGVGSTLYFAVVGNSTSGSDLWRTDGTAAGTFVIRPPATPLSPFNLTNVNGTLFFWQYKTPTFALTLWTSDGTVAGTRQVSTVLPQSDRSPTLREFTAVGRRLYFALIDRNSGAVWTSDGTPAGTYAVYTGGTASNLIAAGERILFFVYLAPGATGKSGLWSSDGTTAGTSWIADLSPPYDPVTQGTLTAGDTAYFNANKSDNGDSLTSNLFKSDGTAGGTVLLSPGTAECLTRFAGAVYFSRLGLWRSDGTPAGTRLITDLGSTDPYDFPPDGLTVVQGSLLFFGWHGLWTSDGTTSGTSLICSTVSGGTASSDPAPFGKLKGKFFFTADDGTQRRLWTTDGTAAGTHPVDELSPVTVDVYAPFPFEGRVIFWGSVANDSGMFITDGTAAGTVKLAPVVAQRAVVHGRSVYFSNWDAASPGIDFWRSDGTPSGTRIVRTFAGASGFVNQYAELAITPDAVFLLVDDGLHGKELWKSDGTADGTVMLTDICPAPCSRYPTYSEISQLTSAGSFAYFVLPLTQFTTELEASDGTTAGTSLVYHSSRIGDLFASGDKLYFLTDRSLVVSDGTAAGTHSIGIFPWIMGYAGANLAGVDDSLFFPADAGSYGMELWRTDPLSTGAVQVRDINPGSWSSYPQNLTAINGTLYFSATDGIWGQELWKSDGTESGTVQVADIFAGAAGSLPTNMTAVGNTLFFSADDGVHGRELWAMQFTDLPVLDVSDITISKTPFGQQSAMFTVSISKVSSSPVTVHFATADWTATAGVDYSAKSGDLTFPAGSTAAQTIVVPLLDNVQFGRSVAFFLNLTQPLNAVVAQGEAMGTIVEPRVRAMRVRRHLSRVTRP